MPKAVALAALEDAGGTGLASRYAKAKKAELAEACERIFAGDVIAEPDVKQAALAWVPEPMRFAPASAADTAQDAPLAESEPAQPVPDEVADPVEEAA